VKTVLNKAERLTAEEYEHIADPSGARLAHSRTAARDRPTALNIVRSHHERYDGSARPTG
jgi:HD-GYP domain-containing protein (c-di-GMP phosphodiesterase class II)